MRIGIVSGRKSVGGMEREAACLAQVLAGWGEDVWFFQRDAWFWQNVEQNDPASWFDIEGLELIGQEGLIGALAESDVVFLPQAAVLDTEEFASYINAVPWVVELNGYIPKFMSPHKLLCIDRYLSHINIWREHAEVRKEPLEKFWDWPGQPVWVESEPAEVREKEWLTFGCLSRQDYIKKLDVLIDAFRDIKGEHKLVLVGDGHDGAKLREYAAGDPRIEFPGMINDRTEVERWFKSFDVYVMTSEWEGGSASAKEAMALGAPCIVSDGGGTPALVGDAAVVVPVGDVEGVRRAMLNMTDANVRRDYRERGLERIEELTEVAEATIAAVLAEAARAPKVAVVIPVGPAHSELVTEAVSSVADQELWPIEAFVIDDGGAVDCDSMPDFVRCFKLETPSGGRPGVPRNFGIERAVAKAIFMLDADDLVFAHGIQVLYEAWRRDPHGVKFGGVIQEGGEGGGKYEKCAPRLWNQERAGRGGYHSVSSLFSKKLWSCIGGFPEDDITYEDARFYAAAETVFGGERIDELIILYRLHTGRQWYRHSGFAKIMNDPGKRAEYHIWIQDKIQEVNAMGDCSGCPGRGGGSRGVGIVAHNPGPGGVLSGMESQLVAMKFLGPQTRYHVNSKVEGSKAKYRFGSRPRDQVKYVLPEDAEWMIMSKLFEEARTPPKSVPAPAPVQAKPKPQPAPQPEPELKPTEIVIQPPFSGPLGQLDLSPQIKSLLITNGLDTANKLRSATLEELTNIRGIGPRTVKQIKEAVGGHSSEVVSDQPSDVEADEPVSIRKRPRRPVLETKEAGRRDRPRRRTGRRE